MRQIIIYVDEGVSGISLKHVVKSLQQELDLTRHSLKRLDAEGIKSGNWEKDTDLIVFPGGRDVYYQSALSGLGTLKIRRFVEQGGSYLGLCAGAYFGADSIEFDKGGRMQVCGKRDLGFFPGVATGPAYGPNKFSYDNEHGAEAALVSWKGEKVFTYFNGGCQFENADHFADVEVLGSYLHLEGSPAAIVSCRHGLGKALLSGVHLEYNAKFITRDDPHIQKIYPLLENGEVIRRRCFRDLLNHLPLHLKSENI
jgi:biotin--protein ligase